MALDDFDSHDSPAPGIPPAPAAPAVPLSATAIRKPVHPEDEDLFDFPVIEMKLEAAPARKPVAPAPVAAPANAVKPVAETPKAQPNSAPAPAPKAAPAKGASAEAKVGEKDVAKAAQLVEDIEQVLAHDAGPHKRKLLLQGPSALTLAGVAALVLTNALGLFFLWRSTQSLHTGVQAMNEQVVETLRRQAQLPVQPNPAQDPTHAAENQATHAAVPLEAFEKSALQMAREEIQAGEYAAARRRLSRLLAVADRIEAEEREDIEAQAAFLIASTYRKQAEAAREKAP